MKNSLTTTSKTGWVIGDVNQDIHGYYDKYPIKGESIQAEKMAVGLGGAGGNTALSLSFLGESPTILATIGKDSWGKTLQKTLIDHGVNIEWMTYSNKKHTGIMYCLITSDGERTILGNRGANQEFYPPKYEVLGTYKYIIISSYLLLDHNARNQIMQLASKHFNCPTNIYSSPLLTTIADTVINGHPDDLLSLINLSDIITMNEREYKLLQDITGYCTPKEMCEHLSLKLLAITQGEKGCMLVNCHTTQEIPGFKVPSVDTTGAGDSFAAGLLYGYLNGFNLYKIGLISNFMGALAALSPNLEQTFNRDKLLEYNSNESIKKSITKVSLENIISFFISKEAF